MKWIGKVNWIKWLFGFFAVFTAATVIIVYNSIESQLANIVVVIFALLACTVILAIPFRLIWNAKYFSKKEFRERSMKFVGFIILYTVTGYLLSAFFMTKSIDLFRLLLTAFGVSIGVAFADLIFFRKNKA